MYNQYKWLLGKIKIINDGKRQITLYLRTKKNDRVIYDADCLQIAAFKALEAISTSKITFKEQMYNSTWALESVIDKILIANRAS